MVPVRFMWQHILVTLLGELTTSSTSSMKGENSSNNRSDLNKNNILKSTFDILMEEGRTVFEAYCADLKELFLSRCEVMW
jgi:hypothetical protein